MIGSLIRTTGLALSLAMLSPPASAEQAVVLPSDPASLFQDALSRAQAGSTDFQVVLGELFEKGIGTEQNLDEAFRWYSEAAMSGHPGAQARLGVLFMDGKGTAQDYGPGVDLLTRAMEMGEPLAIARLGLAHVHGHGVPADPQLGMQMLAKASEKGNGAAAYELAKIHLFGSAGTIDKSEAKKWFQISANLGFPNGQYVYGRDYVSDPVERLRLTFLAAHGGQRHAQYDVGQHFLNRTSPPADQNEAVKWFRLAALNGNQMGNQALFKLGLPDVNGKMPINSTVPSTAMPEAQDADELIAFFFVAGVSAVVLSALNGGDQSASDASSYEEELYCNYGEIDMGGYCAPPICGYGEFNAGGFCMSYPDDWMGGN